MRTPIWVFGSSAGAFGIFRESNRAADWILRHGVTGMLSAYPLDEGAYDWAVANGHFSPKREKHREPGFISSFISGAQEHLHFQDGQCLHEDVDIGEAGVENTGEARIELAWVFYSGNVSGVFSTRQLSVDWITNHRLTGLLGAFPPDSGYFLPPPSDLEVPDSVELSKRGMGHVFSSSARELYRFEDGVVE